MDAHSCGAKGRGDGGAQLLVAGTVDGPRFFVRNPIETRARADLQAGDFDLHLDVVVAAAALPRLEGIGGRLVADQVISAQVVQDLADSAAEVIVVVDEDPARFLGQVVQTPL